MKKKKKMRDKEREKSLENSFTFRWNLSVWNMALSFIWQSECECILWLNHFAFHIMQVQVNMQLLNPIPNRYVHIYQSVDWNIALRVWILLTCCNLCLFFHNGVWVCVYMRYLDKFYKGYWNRIQVRIHRQNWVLDVNWQS